MTIVSYKVFSRDTAMNMKAFFGNSKSMSIVDFLSQCFTAIEKMLHIGDLVASGVPFCDALFSKDPVYTLLNKARDLLYFSEKLYIGVAVEGQMYCREFIVQCDELMTDLAGVLSYANPAQSSTIEGKKTILILCEARYKANILMSSTNRVMPFGIILHGEPGIGKSKILNWLADLWETIRGREFSPSHIFHRIVTSEYWEGYQPYSQPIIHYSELGNIKPKIAAAQGDKPTAEITSLMDTLPYFVDMAFGEKGKTCAQPELVLSDTNNPDLNLEVMYKNSSAIKRRFVYIEPIVKEQFRKKKFGTN
jgi:hypothetical protein